MNHSPKWPKYRRQAVTTDPKAFPKYLNTARSMASSLKTPALKVAFQERMRYFSNRIAQTVLHRQWMDDQARENAASERLYLAGIKRRDRVVAAAKIAGSRARLAMALSNTPFAETRKPKPYRLGFVGGEYKRGAGPPFPESRAVLKLIARTGLKGPGVSWLSGQRV